MKKIDSIIDINILLDFTCTRVVHFDILIRTLMLPVVIY